MVESGILAEGSVRGIINGTHFNRYKKLHVVAAISFKILHIKGFLEKYYSEDRDQTLFENEIIEILERHLENPKNWNASLLALDDLMKRYNSYTEETLDGKYGLTA